MTQSVYESSIEKLACKVKALNDPTGGTIEFAFISTSAEPAVQDWVAGAWSGSWDTVKKEVWALLPSIPASGSDKQLAAGTYYVWARVTVIGEASVQYVDQVVVE